MTKNLNQIIFFFLHQNQNIFFSNIGNQNIFLEKKHTPPPFKLNGRSLIFNAGKNFRSKIRSSACPHGVPPGMFSMVIVEISAESVKACSFHQRKSIPETEIIYSTSFRYNRFANSFFPQLL